MKIIGTTTSRAGRTRLRTVIGLIAAVVMTLGLVAPGSAGATGGGQSGGVSANPVLGALSAQWWQWRISIPQPPTGENSAADCDKTQTGSIFFLSGSTGSGAVKRDCTVPYGRSLFFPLINAANIKTEDGETAEDLWYQLHSLNNWKVLSVTASLDRVPLPGLSAKTGLYRGCAGPERGCYPESFPVVAPAGNIFGVTAGVHDPSIADGYYALIPSLPRGVHTIKFTANARYGTGTFGQDVTYKLTIR